MDSPIDQGVGMLIKKKVGDSVRKGEPLAVIYANNLKKARQACHEIRQVYQIGRRKTRKLKKILFIVDEKGTKKFKSD